MRPPLPFTFRLHPPHGWTFQAPPQTAVSVFGSMTKTAFYVGHVEIDHALPITHSHDWAGLMAAVREGIVAQTGLKVRELSHDNFIQKEKP